MGINVINVHYNVDVNRDCTFGEKLSQIPVPLMRGHLQCRDTFAWPDRCPYKTGSTVQYFDQFATKLRCRAQWLRGRALDSRLREPGFESCAVVLKPWASFFTLHCSSLLNCINE